MKHRKKIVILIDLFIIIFSYSTFSFLTNKKELYYGKENLFLLNLVILVLSIGLCQYALKTYDNIWRYAEHNEYLNLVMGVTLGFIFYYLITHCLLRNNIRLFFLLAVCSVSNLFMLIVRFYYRWYRNYYKENGKENKTLGIIGAGIEGVRLLEEIKYHPESKYTVKCFFDDNIEKIGKSIHGVKVLGPIDKITDFIESASIQDIIIAIPSLSEKRKLEILMKLSKTNLHVMFLPDLFAILQEGKNSLLGSIRELNTNLLLGRESVSFDQNEIDQFLSNKVVMVTGGGGSIGSELCRQIARANPSKLVIIDNYENNAYEIQQELLYEYKDTLNLFIEIASVQDKEKMEQLFERYRPQIVFHAAAHKHVPLMEDCPDEAIKNNIFGTYHTVRAAEHWKVEKFVLISTDKAVNPTSIMGASKRVCEMIVQSMNNSNCTKYLTVRFGNVLGSNGSVIPLFQRQIEHGGPVTITDKRANRYFMTIPEAAQLVLRAGSMASKSEVYILDMGQPINILTLAENLIRLLGYIPYEEIPIKEIGIRPGEKLNEELLMRDQELIQTKNNKIFIEKQDAIGKDDMEEKILLLENALETKNKNEIIKALKIVVPNFRVRKEEDN